jgi:hypothetical protein
MRYYRETMMNPNEYWLVLADKEEKVYHMITLDQWIKGEPVACGKRWTKLSHASYKKWKLMVCKRCPVCFVLVSLGER